MKTKLIAVMLVAGGSAFAQGQFGGDVNGGGPGYNGAQGRPDPRAQNSHHRIGRDRSRVPFARARRWRMTLRQRAV